MTENDFWSLIGEAPSDPYTNEVLFSFDSYEKQYARIKAHLLKCTGAEIISFHNILCAKIKSLFLPKIAEVFLVSTPELLPSSRDELYISNDGFIDFRAWIVSLGQKHYDLFLHFQTEREVLCYDLDPNITWREDLVYIALSVCQDLGIDIELDYYVDKSSEDLYAGIELEQLSQKYPLLIG